MTRGVWVAALLLTAAVCLGSGRAHAQAEQDPHLMPAARKFDSPERFILELRGGPYTPKVANDPAGSFFKNDKGPNLGLHIDGIVYRKPQWFYVTLGGSIGIANFSGGAVAAGTDVAVSEQTTLAIVPLQASIGLRFDALARLLHIPLIFAGRVGWEWAHWDTNTGKRDDAAGWALGPVLSGQVALDLDAFEPGGARNLDEEWGINHTYLFGEIFHFEPTAKSLPIGATSWLVGLGFIF